MQTTPIMTEEDGYGPIFEASYNLTVEGSKEKFEQFKEAYTTDPGIIHNPNNIFAQYYPFENPDDGDNYLDVGDHMRIPILEGILMDVVRFTDVQVSENSFSITAATLLGHTDAGTINFSGSYNPDTGEINYSINNRTTNGFLGDYIVYEAVGELDSPGRNSQNRQWEQVLTNAENFLEGETHSKYSTIKILAKGPRTFDKTFEKNFLTGEEKKGGEMSNTK